MLDIVGDSFRPVGPRQYHTGLTDGEAGTVAVLPDDLGRVEQIAAFLDDPQEVAFERELRTVVGTYQGRRIAVTSTGMGCSSTAIAAEELIRVGVTSLIRVGGAAGVQPGMRRGDLIVSEGALRNDGTTAAYVHPGYPAVPDLSLTAELIRQSQRTGAREHVPVHLGLTACDDAFYASGAEWFERLRAMSLVGLEMEASALFVVARLRGVRAAMVCMCTANLVDSSITTADPEGDLQRGWSAAVHAALDTAVSLEL